MRDMTRGLELSLPISLHIPVRWFWGDPATGKEPRATP